MSSTWLDWPLAPATEHHAPSGATGHTQNARIRAASVMICRGSTAAHSGRSGAVWDVLSRSDENSPCLPSPPGGNLVDGDLRHRGIRQFRDPVYQARSGASTMSDRNRSRRPARIRWDVLGAPVPPLLPLGRPGGRGHSRSGTDRTCRPGSRHGGRPHVEGDGRTGPAASVIMAELGEEG